MNQLKTRFLCFENAAQPRFQNMILDCIQFSIRTLISFFKSILKMRIFALIRPLWAFWRALCLGTFQRSLLWVAIATVTWLSLGTPTALAGLKDDRYDGNIFPLYAGNGSLVPPRFSLSEALKRPRPALVFYYLDDSQDCKEYASVISQLDAFYGRAADFIALNVDTIQPKNTYEPTEPGFYYSGFVPQTMIIDESGQVVFNESGSAPFEKVDDAFREVFNLLPRSESVELKRRQANEINVELVSPDVK